MQFSRVVPFSSRSIMDSLNIFVSTFRSIVMMDEPRFAQPIPNVTVAVGRDANLPCVVEHLGAYKVSYVFIEIIHFFFLSFEIASKFTKQWWGLYALCALCNSQQNHQ